MQRLNTLRFVCGCAGYSMAQMAGIWFGNCEVAALAGSLVREPANAATVITAKR